jgi:putative ABC transport system permease protein
VAITELAVKVNHTGDISKTTKALHAWLSKHTSHVQIYLQSPESLIKSMQASSATMTRLLGFIGAISLIVGGIGIMNMMLISVMERQKEIGLRMAVGATRRRIQCQFLVEACVLSLIGGGVGTLLGLLITEGVALYSHWTQTFFLFPPLLGLGMSLVMGIGFGWYPAWKAAQLDPIQTLRAVVVISTITYILG